jgi:hypothetical protein
MNHLVGVGGIYVPSERVNALERTINQICSEVRFPPNEEFKWSPRRRDWMHNSLIAEAREEFLLRVLTAASEHDVRVSVVLSDTRSKHPTKCENHEEFAVQLLIERIEWLAAHARRDVIVVFDRPGGAHANEENFLATCLETIQTGTPFIRPERIALNALSTSSHFVRLLQTADLITGCVTGYVAGESRFSPNLMPVIRPMLATNGERVGGFGIKIHPDFWYANLYHWLFGDNYFWRGNWGRPFPLPSHPYHRSAEER